jgi:hypothetical protein
LGSGEGVREIYFSDNPKNFGGFSFFPAGSNTLIRKKVHVKNAAEFFREIGLSQIDLIKIDTEGSEYDILTALDPNMVKTAKWIVGELHGVRDFEVLGYLDQWFDISVKRSFKKRLFMFRAMNKNLELKTE